MDTSLVLELGMQALLLAAKLSAPILLTALVVGFVISLLQSITQIQEVTLSFVPKMISIAVVLFLCGNWMISESVQFFHYLFEILPKLIEG